MRTIIFLIFTIGLVLSGNDNTGTGSGSNQGSDNQNQGSGNQNQGMGSQNQGMGSQNQGMGNQNQNQGSGNQNQGSGNQNQGSGNQNQGSGNQNQGMGNQNQNQGSGNQNQGSGNQNQGSGNQNQGSGNQNQNQNQGSGNQNQGSGNQNQNQGSGNQNQNQGSGNQNQNQNQNTGSYKTSPLTSDQIASNFFQQCFNEVYQVFESKQNQNQAMSNWVSKWYTNNAVIQILNITFNGCNEFATFTSGWLSNYVSFSLTITEVIAVQTGCWDYHAIGVVCAQLNCGCRYLSKVHFSVKLNNNQISNLLMDWNLNDCVQQCSNDGYDVSDFQNWIANCST